jgi:ketopantoate reductase
MCVIGSGRMGSLYGALLAKSGLKVTLYDTWREHIEAIRQNGLRVDGISGDFTIKIPATTEINEIAPCDIALVFSDTNGTAHAADAARQVLTSSGYVLTPQNGIGNVEILSNTIGASRVLAGLEISSTPAADELQSHVIAEALAVVKAQGIVLPEEDPKAVIKAFCKVKFNKPSMLQHMEEGRQTEVDALNGAVVRVGQQFGIDTPYNRATTLMVKAREEYMRIALRKIPIDYEALELQAKKAAQPGSVA